MQNKNILTILRLKSIMRFTLPRILFRYCTDKEFKIVAQTINYEQTAHYAYKLNPLQPTRNQWFVVQVVSVFTEHVFIYIQLQFD